MHSDSSSTVAIAEPGVSPAVRMQPPQRSGSQSDALHSDGKQSGSRAGDASSSNHLSPGGGSHRWWWRSALLVLVSGAALAFIGQWLLYRHRHVVSHEAVVKGAVARVGSRLEGRLAEVRVRLNERVRKGDVLARLEDGHLRAAVAQAKAERDQAVQALKVERSALESERLRLAAEVAQANMQMEVAASEILSAQSVVRRWQREHDRIASVATPHVIAASEVDAVAASRSSALAALEAAKARQKVAEYQHRAAEASSAGLEARQLRLALLEQGIQVAEAALAAAETELESAQIRAPEDGWVARRNMEPGASVRFGDSIVSLWLGERLWLEAWVDQENLEYLEIGSPVDVKLVAYPDQVMTGTVEAIGVLSDVELTAAATPENPQPLLGQSPKVSVQIALPESELRIMPGLSAVVGIRTADGSTSPSELAVSD